MNKNVIGFLIVLFFDLVYILWMRRSLKQGFIRFHRTGWWTVYRKEQPLLYWLWILIFSFFIILMTFGLLNATFHFI